MEKRKHVYMYYILALSHACTLGLNVVFLLMALTLCTTISAVKVKRWILL